MNKSPHWNKSPPSNFAIKLISVHHVIRASTLEIFPENNKRPCTFIRKCLLVSQLELLFSASCINFNTLIFVYIYRVSNVRVKIVSIIDESKEEYLKKLCFILLSGRLVTFL